MFCVMSDIVIVGYNKFNVIFIILIHLHHTYMNNKEYIVIIINP